MPIKFDVKIVRLKVYVISASPMTLTLTLSLKQCSMCSLILNVGQYTWHAHCDHLDLDARQQWLGPQR